MIPLLHDYQKAATEVDVLLADAFESLCRGRPVHEVHCPACNDTLPPAPLRKPGQLNQPCAVKCAKCGTMVKYQGLNSPFARYTPVLYTVDGTTGIFLTVKGAPPGSGRVQHLAHAGTEEQGTHLAALGISAPQLDLVAEIKPL